MNSWRKLALFVGLPSVMIVWTIAWLGDGFFGGREVCTTCGRIMTTSRIFWIPSSRIEATELSRFYDSYKGHEADHNHTWLFASGGGGSILCAIGRGRHLYSAVKNEKSRVALELIAKNGKGDSVDRWLGRLLDPVTSQAAYLALSNLAENSNSFDESYQEAEEFFADTRPPTKSEQEAAGQPSTRPDSK